MESRIKGKINNFVKILNRFPISKSVMKGILPGLCNMNNFVNFISIHLTLTKRKNRSSENRGDKKNQLFTGLQCISEVQMLRLHYCTTINFAKFLPEPRRVRSAAWPSAPGRRETFEISVKHEPQKLKITQKNAYQTYVNMYIIGFVFLRPSW